MPAGQFVPDPSGIQSFLLGPAGPVFADLDRRGGNVEAMAKQLCPVDTGLLRSSITHRTEIDTATGLPVCLIGTATYYARFRHDGTGIYGPSGARITPKNGNVLRWPTRGITSSRPSRIAGRGRVVSKSQTPTGFAFATSVAGTPGVPFLLDALEAAAA